MIPKAATPELICQDILAYNIRLDEWLGSGSPRFRYVLSSITPTGKDNYFCNLTTTDIKSGALIGTSGTRIYPNYIYNYACPAGYYFSDQYGVADANGSYYCTKQDTCYAPYSNQENGICVAYCPQGSPLNTSLGGCAGSDNHTPSFTPSCPKIPQVPQVKGDPVVIADGALYEPENPDYAAAGHFPLQFSRTYHGHNSPNVPINQTGGLTVYRNNLIGAGWVRYVQPSTYTGIKQGAVSVSFTPRLLSGVVPKVPGYGYQLWRHNFNYVLDLTNASRVLLIPPLTDNKVAFPGSGVVRTANNLSGETLTKVTDTAGVVTWVYRDNQNTRRVFNAKGLFIAEQDASGLSHHLTYDVASRLTSVSDDVGHTLSFSYDNYGRISMMTTPVGSVTYSYDSKGNLIAVGKPLGTRTYHYEDSRFPYALTGITDERGVRYTSWTYDDMGRVTDNHGADEQNKTTFAYTNTRTTVTNPLGKADVYNYSTVGGARRLVSVAGQASTSCLAANQNYSYNSNGTLASKTDWQGHVTAYVYNPRGLVTKVTEAQGTNAERVTTTEWHSTLPLPTKITQGNQVVTYSYDSAGRLTGQQVRGQ